MQSNLLDLIDAQLAYYYKWPPDVIAALSEDDWLKYYAGLTWIRQQEAKHNQQPSS